MSVSISNTEFTNEMHYCNIKKYLDSQLGKYRGICYGYAVLNKCNRDDILIISNLPSELVQRYIDNKCQCIDPVIYNALNQFAPFYWDRNLMVSTGWVTDKVFGGIKNVNIIKGCTFVLHDHYDNLALLILYTAESSDTLRNINKNEIQGVLIAAHKMLVQNESEKNKLTADRQAITFRENEILYWCSVGKTYREIAELLGIKIPTVKYHMRKVVEKLGVSNVKHAISLSVARNIICPPY